MLSPIEVSRLLLGMIVFSIAIGSTTSFVLPFDTSVPDVSQAYTIDYASAILDSPLNIGEFHLEAGTDIYAFTNCVQTVTRSFAINVPSGVDTLTLVFEDCSFDSPPTGAVPMFTFTGATLPRLVIVGGAFGTTEFHHGPVTRIDLHSVVVSLDEIRKHGTQVILAIATHLIQ